MREVLAAYPRIGPLRQTVECSVMDIADDIAYSLHDLDDFHRAGVLQHASVAAEFRTWIRRRAEFARGRAAGFAPWAARIGTSTRASRWSTCGAGCRPGTAGSSTTTPSAWRSAGSPPTSSTGCSRCRSTRRWPPSGRSTPSPPAGSSTCGPRSSVTTDPPVRAGHVVLGRQAWHEVAVLKFVHQRFVLDRPDLAMFQRGQAEALTSLVANLESWLTDPIDAGRAPRRLLDLVELATAGYRGWRGRNRSCWSGRPASPRPPGRTSSGWVGGAASSTTSRRSPTTGPRLRAHDGGLDRATVGRRVRSVTGSARIAGPGMTKRRTVAGGGIAVEVPPESAGRLGQPFRRPERRPARLSAPTVTPSSSMPATARPRC